MLSTSYTSPSSSSPWPHGEVILFSNEILNTTLHLLISSVQMQHLGSVDKVEDLLDEVVKEDCFTQAEAEVPGNSTWFLTRFR